jgi:hypothetical protein
MNKAKTWEVHYFDYRVQLEKTSRVFLSRESALLHACDLERERLLVRYVEGPRKERIMPPEIAVWCKGHRTPLKPADE